MKMVNNFKANHGSLSLSGWERDILGTLKSPDVTREGGPSLVLL